MKTNKIYNLILVDDHILLRDALANLINSFEAFTVIAVAGNGKEVIQCFETGTEADIVLMDLNMPEMDGYATTDWLVKNRPNIKIVILTMYDTEITLIRLLRAGVHGFLKKDIHPDELENALLVVAQGEYYYSNHTALKLASLFRKDANDALNLEKYLLSDTEIEFLKLASMEMTYKDIALTMNLSPKAIDNLRDILFVKLGVRSRVGLVLYAVKNGIINF
jgi:DNA-binding NarL/FixJ family response regulator